MLEKVYFIEIILHYQFPFLLFCVFMTGTLEAVEPSSPFTLHMGSNVYDSDDRGTFIGSSFS